MRKWNIILLDDIVKSAELCGKNMLKTDIMLNFNFF